MKKLSAFDVLPGLLALAIALSGSAARAADARTFDIPSTEAVKAIPEFARQAGVQIVAPADELKGVRTRALRGQFDTRAALSQLLIGTGLEVASDDGTIITLRRAEADGKLRQHQTSSAERSDGLRMARVQAPVGADGAGVARDPQSDDGVPDDGTSQPVPEILVKGSKVLNMDIRRSADDAQPYVVFDRAAIERSGARNLENFLRDRLPMNAAGVANSQRVTQIGSRSSFNMRGLGSAQTLILIDGHRTVNGPAFGSTPLQPDVNSIPLSAIERVEILPATSSGIHGGNATGGVINIVTRQDYSGMEIKAVYGDVVSGRAPQQRVELGGGTNLNGGRTQVNFAGSYSDEDGLKLRDRRSLVERYYELARANAPANIFPPGNPPLGSTPNIRSVDGSDLVLKSDGTSLNSSFTFVPRGYAGIADGGAALVANAGQYNFELPDVHQIFNGTFNQIGQGTETAALRAALQHEFGERVRVFLEGNYSEMDTAGWVNSVTNGSALQPYTISAAAPTNPFVNDILVTVPTDSLASVMTTSTIRSRFMGGVIFGLPGLWQAEADYTWARDRTASGLGSLFTTGMDVVDVLAGGVDVLRDPAVQPIDLSSYMADESSITPQKITLNDIAVRLSGPLFRLPAGRVTLASLLEYREETFSETLQIIPGLFTFLYPDRSASTYSAYVETRFPLSQKLELQVAGRFDRYKTLGKTGFVIDGLGSPIDSARNTTDSFNPTVALRYQPSEDLALRASYGTGFVPPDASQLVPTQNLLFESLLDPRRGNTPVDTAGVVVQQGGNPDLDPEESENLSFGFIFTPRLIPGLRASLDFTRIEKTRNIAAYPTGLQGILNDEELLPSRVVRGDNLPGDQPGWAGPVRLINATLFNVARAQVQAVDMQLDYIWSTGAFGEFALSAIASRQLHLKTQALTGQPTVERVGRGFSNPQAFNGNAQLNWRRENWNAGWSARYYHSYNAADPARANQQQVIELQGGGGRVASQTYHDLYVGYEFGGQGPAVLRNTRLRLGVRNVFDELPPFDAGIFFLMRELYSPLGDALKRSYTLSVTRQF